MLLKRYFNWIYPATTLHPPNTAATPNPKLIHTARGNNRLASLQITHVSATISSVRERTYWAMAYTIVAHTFQKDTHWNSPKHLQKGYP